MSEEKSGNEEVLYVIGNGFDINLGLKTRYNNYFENFGIERMKEVLNLLRKDRNNIKNYSSERLKNLQDTLKNYNIDISLETIFNEFNEFLESLMNNDKEAEVKSKVKHFHRDLFSVLKINGVYLIDYGLFIIFLVLLNTKKDEWQWIERQIEDYIKDIVDIVSVIANNSDKTDEFISYIIEKNSEIEENMKNYSKIVVEKRDFNKSVEEFYKNKVKNKMVYDSLIKILSRKTFEYIDTFEYIENNKKYLNDEKEKKLLIVEYENYVQNLIYKIEYLYFSLEIFLRNPLNLKFDKEQLEIINKNNNIKISLKEELYGFENHFGNYALKVNEYIMNILNKDLERNVTKNEFIDIELSLKSEIEKRLKRIFGFETRDKRIISFNYTTYLNYYENNSSQDIPIKNLKELINVNGNVDDYKKINDNLEYQERKSIEGAEKIINNIICELKKLKQEVQKQCERIDELKYFIEKLDYLVKQLDDFIKSLSKREIKKINKLWLEIERITSMNYEIFHIEDKYKEKLKNILSPNKKEYNTEIIFGIDEIQKDDNYKELDEFFKSNRRSAKLSEKINKLLERQFSKVYFYGHSLADADYTFFEKLFNKIDIDNSEIKLIFLYSKGYSCEKNVRNLMNRYAKRNNKLVVDYVDKLQEEGKLELKKI